MFREFNGGKASRASNDDICNLVIWITSSKPDLDNITAHLRSIAPTRVQSH